MTIAETGALNFTAFKSGTGLTANNIQSYYRNSGVTGFAPDSGSISFSDLYGGYVLTGPNSALSNYNRQYYPYDGSGTQYNDYYSSNVFQKTYSGAYYYYNILNYFGASGVTWPGTFSIDTIMNSGYTACRMVYSGWPNEHRSGYSGGTYGPYPYTFFYDHGQMIPMGAIGESSSERMHAFRTTCTVTGGGGYYYYYYIFIEIFANQNPSSGYYSYFAPGGSNVAALNDQNYCVGLRVSSSGNLYLGRYSWPSSSTDAAVVSQEVSMFGSVFAHRNNQLAFSVDAYASQYSGTPNFTFYSNNVWYKNTYTAKGWNINNLAYNTAPSNFGFKTSF